MTDMNNPRSHFGDRAGMTIMELSVVLVLVAIVASFMAPVVDVFKPGVRGSALEVSTTLATSQRTAVVLQHNVVVMFDTDQAALRIHSDADNDGTVDSGETVRWVMLEETGNFGRGSAPAIDVRTDGITFTGRQNGYPALTFHRNGSASEEGITYLTSRRPGSSPDDARAIRVERGTGQVTCLRYRNSLWAEGC
jgi:prepilin-type N-terminal cleavage/methylation domain-containing protein